MNRRHWVGRMRGWPPDTAPAVFDSYTTEDGEPYWWINGTGFPERDLESTPAPAVVVAADDLGAVLHPRGAEPGDVINARDRLWTALGDADTDEAKADATQLPQLPTGGAA